MKVDREVFLRILKLPDKFVIDDWLAEYGACRTHSSGVCSLVIMDRTHFLSLLTMIGRLPRFILSVMRPGVNYEQSAIKYASTNLPAGSKVVFWMRYFLERQLEQSLNW
jgi:hypothetical protein